ncbi:MAG: glutathione S-transferase family protein [Spirochaetota bacterium]
MHKFRLISFKLCPFVQRSVIVLKEKKIPFEIEYIDLANKPDWFLKISPTGKVPVIEVEGRVLFESAVIMEYLDEVNPPSLHPTDAFEKAQDRAWIEFSSNLLVLQYQLSHTKSAEDYAARLTSLRAGLTRFAGEFRGPYWHGENFSLVDAAIAPLFTRIGYTEDSLPEKVLSGMPRMTDYMQTLQRRESILHSVLPEVPEAYRASLRAAGGVIAQWL